MDTTCNLSESETLTLDILLSRGFEVSRLVAEDILSKYQDIYIIEKDGYYYPVIIDSMTVRFVKPTKGLSFKTPFVMDYSVSVGKVVDGVYTQPEGFEGFELHGFNREESSDESEPDMKDSYIIISNASTAKLSKMVNEKMEHYVPIGGVCYDGTEYHQSMACKDFYMRDLTKQNEGGKDDE